MPDLDISHLLHPTQATTKQLAKNWIVSYFGNIVGTAALALLCQRALVFSPATSAGITAIAATKASLPFSVVRFVLQLGALVSYATGHTCILISLQLIITETGVCPRHRLQLARHDCNFLSERLL